MWLASWFRKPTFAPHPHRRQRRRPPSRSQPGIEILENRWLPSTLTVTTSVDEVDPNDGVLSLREAIAAAKSGATINFADGVSGSALTLGQLVIDKSLTIEGQSKNGADIFSLNGDSRALDVSGTVNVTLVNLFIAGTADHGGGVLNEGALLTISDCHVGGTAVVSGPAGLAGNVAGGAIYNAAGTVSLSNSLVVGQAIAYGGSSALGGGIYNAAGVTLLVTNCTFSPPPVRGPLVRGALRYPPAAAFSLRDMPPGVPSTTRVDRSRSRIRTFNWYYRRVQPLSAAPSSAPAAS
jgi:CSLREA domain-containing protein